MRRRFIVRWMVTGSMALAGASDVLCQTYPVKPIRIVASEPGGGGDFVARLLSPGLSSALGQPVVIDNRQTGIIQGEIVAKAPPDGYTLLVNSGSMWIGQLLNEGKTSYDVGKDFAPITITVTAPSVLVVHPSLPVRSVKELIALAKARPGELNYSSGSTGSSTGFLTGESFKSMAGINIVHIPYKGSGYATTALVAGEVQLAFATATTATQHIKSGRVRALAVTSAQPSALFPQLPTVTASGLRGFESSTTYGMFAPAQTPAAIVDRLNQETVRILQNSDIRNKILNAAVEPVGSSPEQLASAVKSEMVRIAKVIKDAGLRSK